MKRKPYPSDLTDEQWAILEPLIPDAKPGGHPRTTNVRELLNALFYYTREGCSLRALPHDFGIPWKTVYNYFRAWSADGTWPGLVDALRIRVRRAAGRDPEPQTGYIDSQSVKTAQGGEQRGYDPAKKVQGRKRHIVVDSLGLLLAVVVTGADVDDARAAQDLFVAMPGSDYPRLRMVWADGKYHNYALTDWLSLHRRPYRVRVLSRPPGSEGWVQVPKRWVVERTFAWLGYYRRLSKDYERLTETSEAVIQISSIHHMLRRLKPAKRKYRFRYKRPRRKSAA
jgi:putative transposase